MAEINNNILSQEYNCAIQYSIEGNENLWRIRNGGLEERNWTALKMHMFHAHQSKHYDKRGEAEGLNALLLCEKRDGRVKVRMVMVKQLS